MTTKCVFIHIPRTAGTSIRIYAERVLGEAAILPVYGDDITNAEAVIKSAPLEKLQMVRGHMTTRCLEWIPEGWKRVTFVRNPIDRVASLYRYIRRDGRHPIHSDVMKMTLDDFVTSGISLEADNGMVRQLCGTEPELPQFAYNPDRYAEHTPYEGMGRANLDKALQVLATFDVVGVQEHMLSSVNNLCNELGWPRQRIPKANSTKWEHLQERTRGLIMSYNHLDFELWRSADRGYQS